MRPSLETLRLCERANPHGGGIAWRNGGAVEWLKTNDVNEIDKLARRGKGELLKPFCLPPPPPKRPETHSKRYHEAEQFEFPRTKLDEEIHELWDMGSIESYWAKLHANNAKLLARAKAGQKLCNLCEGPGHREVAGREAKCELCNGSGFQPNTKIAGAEPTSAIYADSTSYEH